MAYFNYMDTPTIGCEEPYSQDMDIPGQYSNSWGHLYHAQEDYEIEEESIHIPWMFEGLENRGACELYTTNEDE